MPTPGRAFARPPLPRFVLGAKLLRANREGTRQARARRRAAVGAHGLSPLTHRALAYDKPLCASRGGFTLHAATRAGALDLAGREALLRYVLRPPLAQERLELRPDGLVRIVLERAFGDGTSAVDMDPLSLLCRLATSVPPPP